MDTEPAIQCIVKFLAKIGIAITELPLSNDTFLPGIKIESGTIVFDRAKLTYPGDLLHEAGHLAVVPSSLRTVMSDRVEATEMNENVIEAAAMLWAYAASKHLGIDPRIVFHANGYRGKSESLLLGFELGMYIGLNVLEEAGMAAGPVLASKMSIEPFPVMQKWLRD